MKIYEGISRGDATDPTVMIYDNRTNCALPLNPRLDLRNHSPSGLSWGYGGSGPAQTSLAILADCIGDEDALEIYQNFKFGLIGGLPQNEGWIMSETVVRTIAHAMLRHKREIRDGT